MENGAETKTSEKVTEEKPADVKTDKNDEETKTEVKKEEIKPEEITEEVLEKIKKQVEFYFGDINLQRDKFLIDQIKLDEGWIPMTVMLKFKLLVSICNDAEVIARSLKSSDLIEVSDDGKKIRRSPKHPLPVFDEAYRKAQAERTVYVKGIPLADCWIQKLKEFLKDYEPFENVVIRKYMDKTKKLQPKGSIFVQFNTLDDAKAFMARESVKYGDVELIRKFSEDYTVEKKKENEERKRLKDGKKENKGDDDNDNSESRVSASDNTEESEPLGLPRGSVVHFTSTSEETSRESLKEAVTQLGAEVAFIDFQRGDAEGWIRLREADMGKVLVDKMEDSKLKIGNEDIVFRTLEGEEEKKYLDKVQQSIKNQRTRTPKRGRGKKGRGGPSRGKKRRGSPARGAVAAKKNAPE